MEKLLVDQPISGGVLLSYRCTSECKHCMYACSPQWKADWITEDDLHRILSQLSDSIQPSPLGPDRIGINYGLHFTGGEPFLNLELLVKATEIADDLGIPSTFVETNSFWCVRDENTREKFIRLRDSGLDGILISVNPFILDQVPFERTQRAIRIGKEVFGENTIAYQEIFQSQFERLNIRDSLSFDEYSRMDQSGLAHAESLPMGRAVYELGHLYRKLPARLFFGQSCERELTRGWHIHVDNYCNYITGYCGGISLGDAREMHSILRGVDLNVRPILKVLTNDLKELLELAVREFGYEPLQEGYVSKCHLCLDVRKHIAQKTDEFKELRPREFYYHLNSMPQRTEA
jgi:hypothetical protein